MNAVTGFPSAELKNLDSFAKEVWGNSQAVLKQINGVQFIDLQRYFLTFQVLLGGAVRHDRILVRDEYHIALQELQTDTYYRGAYVIGQPGIGKTLFLIYALVSLLGQKCAVAVQSADGGRFYALFKSSATLHSLDDRESLFKCGFLWALSDSNQFVEGPSGIFCGIPSVVRVIQTTSPKASRWKEWSKQVGARRYVMDIWSEKEVADLAMLLGWDAERITTLAREWGGVPRTLQEWACHSGESVESLYLAEAENAVQNSRAMITAAVRFNIPYDAPSAIYFLRPRMTSSGVDRQQGSISVPTPTLRRVLARALMGQLNEVKLQFYNALSQPEETRQAAGFIYESWFHIFFSSENLIQCQWLQGSDSTTWLRGTTNLIQTSLRAPRSLAPPYYWVAPKSFPGIDSALVLQDEIFVFQVTISGTHVPPIEGLRKLYEMLPNNLKDTPWRVVFIGPQEGTIRHIVEATGKISFPTKKKTLVPIGWSVVDPVQNGVTYTVFHDESEQEMEVEDE